MKTCETCKWWVLERERDEMGTCSELTEQQYSSTAKLDVADFCDIKTARDFGCTEHEEKEK